MYLNHFRRFVVVMGLVLTLLAGSLTSAVEAQPKAVETKAYSEQLVKNPIGVELDTPFRLSVGRVASINSEQLGIKFIRVTEDSRCPIGVDCIQAGQVTIELKVFNKTTTNLLHLTSKAGSEDVKNFDGYLIKLVKVDPYPRVNQVINTSDYVATLIVSKSSTSPDNLPSDVANAVLQAAQKLTGENRLVITEFEKQTWPDGCLGLGGPNEICLQALEPGYRVTVEVAGVKRLIYRTNESGSQIRLQGTSDEVTPNVGNDFKELTRNQQLWNKQGVLDYRYTLTNSCFCIPDARGPVIIQVSNGTTSSVTVQSTGQPANRELFNRYDTIPKLFDVIRDAIARRADSIKVQYNPTLGYPTEINIDYDRRIADEELFLTVGNFTK